ncbi:amino acid adenylation domain-containing protein, partial [Rhodoferax sp. OV413]|uniref:amino acid adenylation domain-containing protein n=1 Tax=Rhodoferax sp. OV413 TaxID=1855285 RepID=UPI0008801E74
PPLLRLVLVRTGPDAMHLVWTSHHLLLDGWSASQLMGDVLTQYTGRQPEVAGRYRDYIAWLAQRDAQADAHFWRSELTQLEAPTLLAEALPAAAGAGELAYRHHRVSLGAAETIVLVEFARAQRITLNTVVQAAWALLLSRYTGQRHVVFGATVAGRPAELPLSQRMLGLFINTLPTAVEVPAAATVSDWLRGILARNLAVREHENAALNDIQRWAGRGGQALFDSIIVFENYPVDQALRQADPSGPVFGAVAVREETHYGLTIAVNQADTLSFKFGHATRQFDTGCIATLATQLLRILAELVQAPNRPVGALELLDPKAMAQVLALGKATDPAPVDASLMPALISRLAALGPDAPALFCGDTAWTRADLERRANRIAQVLMVRGAAPGARVGIALRRSADMLAGLLAIWKVGAAYVPLDPTYPVDRLAHIVADSGIVLLLTRCDETQAGIWPAGLNLVDVDHAAVADAADIAPLVSLHAQSLAYVIYTSGSTGLPKGVAVAHGALAMHMQAVVPRFGLRENDRCLLAASINFDAAGSQWMAPLAAGAAVVVLREHEWALDEMARLIVERQVTVVHFPPAYLRELAQAHTGGRLPLRVCIAGGEALPTEDVALVFDACTPQWLANSYGPTEAVVSPCVWRCDGPGAALGAYAPIGRPVGTRLVRVLDADLRPVPSGAVGELYIGGEGLARGYLSRPGLSAERYVADPFGLHGERLYRSGDLVRWRADGELAYICRADFQIKVRGFRIEPGEIEFALLAQAGVREAVALAQDEAGRSRLVAYVGLEDGAEVQADALRAALAQCLPEYMVPVAIALLPRLPRTINGKVDRLALPPITAPKVAAQQAPQGGVEVVLAAIWCEVLRLAQVGRHDNFFEI